jgi:xanthine dehydrogenase YagS FAD-binding subunit
VFPFRFSKAADEAAALAAAASGARYIAGGTTLIDLMRETVERPAAVVDINALPYRDIDL